MVIKNKSMKNEKKSKKVLNVPNLRFKEFSGEWGKYKLKEVVNIYDGTHQTPNYTKQGIPFVSVEDIKNINKENKFISIDEYNKNFKIHPEIGDILMTRIGDIGTPAIIDFDKKMGYYVSLALLRPFNIETLFLNYYIQTKVFKKELWIRTIHEAFPIKINKDQIGKCSIKYTTKNEQQKIANFLSLIDKQIETQIKIIEEYKSLIKGIREKLIFYNNKLDRVIKVKDVADCMGGYAFDSSSYIDNGKYRIITIGNVTGDEYINISNINCIDDLPNDIQDYQILKQSDILISLTGNVGRVSKVNCDNCLLNQRVAVLRIKNKKLQNYIYYCLSSKVFENAMIKCGQGAAQKNINNSDIENFNITFSDNITYIFNICSIIKNFDLVLHNNTTLLNKFYNIKKYLLNNMFI